MRYALTLLIALAVCSSPMAAEDSPLGEEAGLAAKYAGDVGIESDPAVLFVESFEQGGVANLENRWNSVSDKGERVISFADDSPNLASGKRCLQLTATIPENEGGHLYKKLPREVDQAFARFYVKFPEDAGYIHHFVHFGGYRPATDWPQGGAGQKPAGDERMTVGIEPLGENGEGPLDRCIHRDLPADHRR